MRQRRNHLRSRATLLPGLHGHRALAPSAMAEVVEGIADGCSRAAAPYSAAKRPRCGFYPKGRYDLAGFVWPSSKKTSSLTASASAWRQRDRCGQRRRPQQRLQPGAQGLEQANANANTLYGNDQRSLIGDLLAPATLYADRCSICCRADASSAWPTSPAEDSRKTCRAACRTAALRIDPSSWTRPPLFRCTGGRRHSRGPLAHVQPWHRFLPGGAGGRGRCDRALPRQEPSGLGDWQRHLK